jgi:4'-phosphopantetheinyl transferase
MPALRERNGDIHVDIRRLAPVTARHARDDQRRVARESRQTASGSLLSHSHSRGIIAVASASLPVVRMGIDVELADPARPWRQIAAMYMPTAAGAALGDNDFCRLWTFGEAHFKAFGKTPSPDLLMHVARLPASDDAQEFAPGRFWRSEKLAEGFWLSVVWERGA